MCGILKVLWQKFCDTVFEHASQFYYKMLVDQNVWSISVISSNYRRQQQQQQHQQHQRMANADAKIQHHQQNDQLHTKDIHCEL